MRVGIPNYEELVKITKQLTKHKINYWLDAGTLLGIYRNQSLLSYDSDIDLGIYLDKFNFNKLNKCMHLISYSHILKKSHVDKIKFIKEFYKIDFFLFHKQDNYYYHEAWNGFFVFRQSCLDTLKKYKCNNDDFYIPNNPELYLEDLYGTDWKIPKIKMAKPQGYHNFIIHTSITLKTHQLTPERIQYAQKMGWIKNI